VLPILILLTILDIYRWILIVRVILSFIPLFKPDWVPPSFLTPVVDVVYGLTEPPLRFLRRFVPQPAGFPFDLSFLVLFLIVGLLPQIIVAGAR
jgi:YggT family protein